MINITITYTSEEDKKTVENIQESLHNKAITTALLYGLSDLLDKASIRKVDVYCGKCGEKMINNTCLNCNEPCRLPAKL